MHRCLEELPRLRQLHDPAEVHDGDPVAHLPDHGEVVGDEEAGQAELAEQLAEEPEHGRLHGEVEP